MGTNHESVQTGLLALLEAEGASMVGVGDLTQVAPEKRGGLDFGVSVAIAMTPEVVDSIAGGPTQPYSDEYDRLNATLDRIVTSGADFLRSFGFQAIAQTLEYVDDHRDDTVTLLPHKTVATRAGLGWIGKDALLVTKPYGSAVRLSSILTDAPLEPASPIDVSFCGTCTVCAGVCPAHAILGENWELGTPRDRIYDAKACKREAIRITHERLDNGKTICGRCLRACPHTQRYISRRREEGSDDV